MIWIIGRLSRSLSRQRRTQIVVQYAIKFSDGEMLMFHGVLILHIVQLLLLVLGVMEVLYLGLIPSPLYHVVNVHNLQKR
jgi:hypothetical protein